MIKWILLPFMLCASALFCSEKIEKPKLKDKMTLEEVRAARSKVIDYLEKMEEQAREAIKRIKRERNRN